VGWGLLFFFGAPGAQARGVLEAGGTHDLNRKTPSVVQGNVQGEGGGEGRGGRGHSSPTYLGNRKGEQCNSPFVEFIQNGKLAKRKRKKGPLGSLSDRQVICRKGRRKQKGRTGTWLGMSGGKSQGSRGKKSKQENGGPTGGGGLR